MKEFRLPMRKKFNSHFGYVDLPSDILEVGIFDDHIEFDCVDGVYHIYGRKPNPLQIIKVFSKNNECDH